MFEGVLCTLTPKQKRPEHPSPGEREADGGTAIRWTIIQPRTRVKQPHRLQRGRTPETRCRVEGASHRRPHTVPAFHGCCYGVPCGSWLCHSSGGRTSAGPVPLGVVREDLPGPPPASGICWRSVVFLGLYQPFPCILAGPSPHACLSKVTFI